MSDFPKPIFLFYDSVLFLNPEKPLGSGILGRGTKTLFKPEILGHLQNVSELGRMGFTHQVGNWV